MEHLGCLKELSPEEKELFVSLANYCGKISHIIPRKMLVKYLKKNKPAGLKKKKDIETWESKISIIATSYQDYIRYITLGWVENPEQYSRLLKVYQKNLEEYRYLMSNDYTNYSLHY
jgi:hypothetical protein